MKVDKVKQGKTNRKKGGEFELRVRKNMEAKGWTVCKWSNNVNLETGELEIAKHKFNPFKKVMTMGTGFPDFIAFKRSSCPACLDLCGYKVIGLEAKTTGYLDKVETKKVEWLLKNHIFKYILVASKDKKGRIDYEIKHLRNGVDENEK